MSHIEVKRKPLRIPRKYLVRVAREVVEEYTDIEVTARCHSEACKKAEAIAKKDAATLFPELEVEYHWQESIQI